MVVGLAVTATPPSPTASSALAGTAVTSPMTAAGAWPGWLFDSADPGDTVVLLVNLIRTKVSAIAATKTMTTTAKRRPRCPAQPVGCWPLSSAGQALPGPGGQALPGPGGQALSGPGGEVPSGSCGASALSGPRCCGSSGCRSPATATSPSR